MSILFTVEIPGLPPTTNHIYRTWGHRARVKAPAVRDWQKLTAATMAAMWKRAPLTDDVSLSLIFVTKDKRRWDLDNRLKALQDTLTMAGIIQDDCQIKRLTAMRCKGEEIKTLVVIENFTSPRRSAIEAILSACDSQDD